MSGMFFLTLGINQDVIDKNTTNLSNSGINIEFIKYVKWAGALVSPNDITKYLYNPYHVVKAVFGISSGRTRI
jgi:hypothetical protein